MQQSLNCASLAAGWRSSRTAR